MEETSGGLYENSLLLQIKRLKEEISVYKKLINKLECFLGLLPAHLINYDETLRGLQEGLNEIYGRYITRKDDSGR